MTKLNVFILIFIYTNLCQTTICELINKDRNYEVIHLPKIIRKRELNPTPVLRQQATVVLPIHVADDDINDIKDEEENIEVTEASVAQNAPVIEPVVPAVVSITEAAIQEEKTTTTAGPYKAQSSTFKSPCSCVGGQCGCCTGKIFNMRTCGNISFVPEDFVFDIKMKVNDMTVLRRRVSADHPPPICFNPKRAPFLQICAEISNIRIRNRNAFACLDIAADIGGFPVYSASFKCFGLGTKGIQAGLKPKPISSGPEPVSLFGNNGADDDQGADDYEGPLDMIEDAVEDIFDGRRLD